MRVEDNARDPFGVSFVESRGLLADPVFLEESDIPIFVGHNNLIIFGIAVQTSGTNVLKVNVIELLQSLHLVEAETVVSTGGEEGVGRGPFDGSDCVVVQILPLCHDNRLFITHDSFSSARSRFAFFADDESDYTNDS